MSRTLVSFVLLLISMHASATDITLLFGNQFNSDFEVSSAENLPSGAPTSVVPGATIQLDDGSAIGLAVDYVFKKDTTQRIGFFLTHHKSSFDSGAELDNDDVDITHLHFTAMSYFPNGNWEPFALLGLGAGNFKPKDGTLKTVTRVSAQIAAGGNYKFSDNMLLRVELRWIPTFFGNSTSVFCDGGCTVAVTSSIYSQVQANIGLQYRF